MKKITPLFFLLFSLFINAQNSKQEEINSRLIDLHKVEDNDENFEGYEQIKKEIGDAQIVMLGEQSHTDATTFQTKIKLIKYLHQEMGFEILAFESNFYECNKAWSMMQEGHDTKDALAKGIYGIWSTVEELNPLFQYYEQQFNFENPLLFAGFDSQFYGKIAVDHFGVDLQSYLATFEKVAIYQEEIQQLQSFINASGRKIKKKEVVQNIAFLQKLITLIEKQNNESSDFWIQTLKSLKVWMSDAKLGTDNRDQQMAENLIWLKEKYPNKKIICWGATSHFLYNSALIKMENKRVQKAGGEYYRDHLMMGDYLKKKYGDDLYTIGFIAHEGTYGYNRLRTLDLPSKNSLEYQIGQSDKDNYFLPLKDISLEGYLSRALGHQYMVNDIAQVMDGVVFNRYMRKPYTDWDFLLYLFPENTISAKKVEKIKENLVIRKQREKREREKRNQVRA